MATAVQLRDKESLHVAGLLVARMLERATLAGKRPAFPGNVGIDAGGMRATIVPSPEGDRVVAGFAEPLVARASAPLRTLLDLAGGRSAVSAFLFGGLRGSGSPRALLALRGLLAAAGSGS